MSRLILSLQEMTILTAPTGRLITFEGVDGCGKTTQLQRLADWLPTSGLLASGQRIDCTREPGDSALGQRLRELLLTTDWGSEPLAPMAELLLYAADRAQHVAARLRPGLAAGDVILCDRYTDSTLAYQGYGRGLDRDAIATLARLATGGLEPHLTFWLDLPVAVCRERAAERGRQDRMEAAGDRFFERLHQGFRDLAVAHPERIVRIDALGDAETVAQRVRAALRERW
jgi:dTMP kinase